jgi:hypothetical protein
MLVVLLLVVQAVSPPRLVEEQRFLMMSLTVPTNSEAALETQIQVQAAEAEQHAHQPCPITSKIKAG